MEGIDWSMGGGLWQGEIVLSGYTHSVEYMSKMCRDDCGGMAERGIGRNLIA